ncbi:hypothetical protein BO86DRAFT_376403 [Aspergillus japonicus CBS 114.51]|uniref:Uncharacterized protein n=1 Tax=Aspergillus japonicus CBS 114.51 TaxID=1448312 RepID=A0A8T8XBD4_ASPJA|nr:hypothetical protein BO86DRAFT_376403 [Aspergillus japonicus CBS 114.51]RAH85395.1 hypothetical protein BO86DRAFT_376403 [Aspergillus japonicus CBS 114.51]
MYAYWYRSVKQKHLPKLQGPRNSQYCRWTTQDELEKIILGQLPNKDLEIRLALVSSTRRNASISPYIPPRETILPVIRSTPSYDFQGRKKNSDKHIFRVSSLAGGWSPAFPWIPRHRKFAWLCGMKAHNHHTETTLSLPSSIPSLPQPPKSIGTTTPKTLAQMTQRFITFSPLLFIVDPKSETRNPGYAMDHIVILQQRERKEVPG